MSISTSIIVFWVIVLMTVGSAILVVATRNILHAAFSLCLTLLGVAGIYVFLHADFVAAVQLIVYVGGILVLIMFGIMFSLNSAKESGEQRRHPAAVVAGLLIAMMAFVVVILLIQRLNLPLAKSNTYAQTAYQPTISVAPGQVGLGHYLMGQYLLPFEVVSVLLLAVLIGAVVIIRKEMR
ncbi:MAG: NADH-quinone oxidoreductase subunit J [Planctomycetota bacterium]